MKKKSKLRLFIFLIVIVAIIVLSVVGGVSVPDSSKLGLEFAGGTQVRVQVEANDSDEDLNLAAVSEVLIKRVDSLGVSNPSAEIEANSGRINLTLAGYESSDALALKNLLESSGNLSFRDTEGTLLLDNNDFPTSNAASLTFDRSGGFAIGLSFNDNAKFASVTKAISEKQNGDRLLYAYLDFEGLTRKIATSLTTEENFVPSSSVTQYVSSYCYRTGVGGVPYTPDICKPHVISRATVNGEITSGAILSGNFSRSEAQETINLINSGTINYQVTVLETSDVSASYGQSALDDILLASLIAILVISLFLVFYYGIFGIISFITMSLYIVASLFIFNQLGGEYAPDTLSALIIGMGMAVDSTIVTLERMKRDFKNKKSLSPAYLSSSKKVIPTILDSNITTFITGFMLFWFGTRTIKGFSVMLLISIFWTLIISVFLNRVVCYFLVKSHYLMDRPYLFGIRYKDVKLYMDRSIDVREPFFHRFMRSIKKETDGGGYVSTPNIRFKKSLSYRIKIFFSKDNFPVLKMAKYFIAISLVIIVIGIVMFSTFQPNLGLDFTGGTRLDISAKSGTTLDATDVTKAITDISGEEPTLSVITLDGATHLIYRIQGTQASVITSLEEKLDTLGYLIDYGTITSKIADELVKNALIAVGAAIGAILLYSFVRFSWTFAIAAVIAILHDVLIIIAIVTILRIELRINAIAAILAIIGYSINDTIVTFSRIREEVKFIPRTYIMTIQDSKNIANLAIRQTLKRSLLTTTTTMAAVLALIIFGPEATTNFSILMLIGLLFGTYSSIFIASYVWVFLNRLKMVRLKKRLNESATEIYGPDEQLIVGINV